MNIYLIYIPRSRRHQHRLADDLGRPEAAPLPARSQVRGLVWNRDDCQSLELGRRDLRSYGRHLLQDGRVVLRVDHARVLGRVVGHEAVAVARMHVAHFIAAAPRVAGRQDALEGLPELAVVDGVDEWIEHRVRVAQPREDLERLSADAGLAEGRHYVDTEEGHPADEEDAHDDAHGDGRLVVGHVVWGGVQLLELRLMRLWPANAAVVLLLGDFPGPGNCPDRFHVLLCIAVQSAMEEQEEEMWEDA